MFHFSVPHPEEIAELLVSRANGLVPVTGTNGLVPITGSNGLVPVSGTNGLVPITANNGLVPITGSNGLVPFTPDPSRSCTPISISATAPSPAISPVGSPAGKGEVTPSKEAPAQVECQWKGCEEVTSEIMDHIRACHVSSQNGKEKVCLWKGCKVYDKPSRSKSWLDQHILTHSGDKPFRCIVDGCGIRFTSQGGLERHVNSHFNAQEQLPNQKNSKHGREDTPTKIFKRKRLKQQKRRAVGGMCALKVFFEQNCLSETDLLSDPFFFRTVCYFFAIWHFLNILSLMREV